MTTTTSTTTLECFQPTTSTSSTTIPSDTYIMVILQSLSESYIINGDGSQSTDVQITSPNNHNRYTMYMVSAVVAGQFYLFGGESQQVSTKRKIAKLDCCAFVELSVELNTDFNYDHAALAIENGSKALICFGTTDPYNFCDVFDGSTVAATFSSTFNHPKGGLGNFNGQPTTVGSVFTGGSHKVETLGPGGWASLDDFPENNRGHDLIGLSNGEMVLIGGTFANNNSPTDKVWKLGFATGWTQIGTLQQPMLNGVAIMQGSSIYSFGGQNTASEFPIQRLDMTEEGTIEQIELIGSHTELFYTPIIIIADSNTCVAN